MDEIGAMRERVEILTFDGEWKTARKVWAHLTPEAKVTYSSNSKSLPGVRGAIRCKSGLSPANLMRWRNEYYAPGDVLDELEYTDFRAAKVILTACVARKPKKQIGNVYNRPTPEEPETIAFPGILAEKYVRWTQDKPNVDLENTVVLVTPKSIVLDAGDLIDAGGAVYSVQLCYLTDLHKNEYEIVRKEDA